MTKKETLTWRQGANHQQNLNTGVLPESIRFLASQKVESFTKVNDYFNQNFMA